MRRKATSIAKLLARPLPFIFILAALSTVVRSIFLTKADIWHDEGYSTAIINYPLGEIITRTINDVHPPLYYLVLSVWQDIFGNSVVSLRGFSVVCGVLAVVFLYMLMRRIFPEKIAKLAGLFAAIGPFLVRYSDEARMYSLAALLAVLSTYLLVVALESTKKSRYLWWVGYGVAISAGIYTQYFFIFLVIPHLIYALDIHKWNFTKLLKNKGWWLDNILGAGLFLPWLPHMLAQTSRVQGGFWIPPMDLGSISRTISHFVTYNNDIATVFGYSLIVLMIFVPFMAVSKLKKYNRSTILLIGWLIIPILAVAALSLVRHVYIDRYFTYSAPAFYALAAVVIFSIRSKKNPWIRPVTAVAVVVLFAIGIGNVAQVATHQMGSVAATVNRNYRPGDAVISAELYTYFDFSYYNKTGTEPQLLSEKPFGRYGEMSLLHDKPQLRIESLSEIKNDRVWLIGKIGEKDYFTTMTPDNWTLISTREAGDSAVRLYRVSNSPAAKSSL